MENDRSKSGKRYADYLNRSRALEGLERRVIKLIVCCYLDFTLGGCVEIEQDDLRI